MPSLTQDIRFGSPLHKSILSACQARVKASRDKQGDLEKRWDEGEKRVQAFMPEREVDAARRVEREGGKPQYTTVQIPYTYAVLLTAHTYWTTVFLSRTPVHQFTARHGEPQMSVLIIEALMDYQTKVGRQLAPLFSWLYDAGKWGHGIIGVHWDERFERVSNIKEVDDAPFGIPNGKKRKIRVTEDIRGYHGNKLSNIRPQNFLHDPRVPIVRFQDGEYCGVYVTTNWNSLIRGHRRGIYTNLDVLKKLPSASSSGGDREEISTDVLDMPDLTDFGTEHVDGKLAAKSVALYEVYIDLVPEDWKLGRGDQPEKWVFTVDESFRVVLGATPLGAYHNKFPFIIQSIDFDAYNVYPRSLPDVIQPLQNTVDWLLNCYAADTEVLTDGGWKLISHLHKDVDKVATVDPKTRDLTFEVPCNYFERDHSGTMIEFDSKRYNACVTPNHQIYSRKRFNGQWKFTDAEEHLSLHPHFGERYVLGSINWQGEEITEFKLPALCGGYKRYETDIEMPVDRWIEYLGYVACDGSVYNSEASGSYNVRITQSIERGGRVVHECMQELPFNLNIQEREKVVGYEFIADLVFGNKQLHTWLVKYLKTDCHDVRVPKFIKNASKRQLKIFWDACMVTDGSTGKDHPNLQRITSVSKQFIDDLQELALKLGFSTLVKWDKNWHSGAWRLSVNTEGRDAACGRRHNVRAVPYKGKVYCFENSTHLTLTRRNGRVMIAGQSHFYNVRAALNNQLVVDPSRLVMKDLLNPLPGGIIRARPQAYGSDVRTAFEQLRIDDVTRGHFSDMGAVIQLGERTHGVNDALMGLSATSSRRSATEVRGSNTFSVSRQKTVADYMSAVGWDPLAQMMVQNTQQYLDGEMQLQQVGDLALTAGTKWLDVSPESIQGFFDYVPVDGSLPVDRFAQATLWRELFGVMMKVPGLAEQFDIARIFAWVAQLTGLKNINQFRTQIVPDGQLDAQAQAGNVVPLGPSNPENLPQPKQARGTGQLL